ncbi:MAG: stalk domain-containing protein, partial [Syntrophomonadaceae bacterium]|nr:stalk domain-containing protein [Syntrophomonadaceae bacterium]
MKNMKNILLIAILACVIILPTQADAVNPAPKVTVNGEYVTCTDQIPFIDSSNRTMVPVRAPMEAIGCTVDWDEAKRRAIITK